jgi:hypothetical protein
MGEFGWFYPAEPTCYQAIKAAIKLLAAALQVLAESGGGAVVTAGDDRRGDRVVLKSVTGTWNEYNVTSHELAVRTPSFADNCDVQSLNLDPINTVAYFHDGGSCLPFGGRFAFLGFR